MKSYVYPIDIVFQNNDGIIQLVPVKINLNWMQTEDGVQYFWDN